MHRILVADDDLELLSAIGEILEHWGYAVDLARNGGELLEALGDRTYDLVITDVSMPWMTGLQVTHSARYAGLPTPILVITALRDDAIDTRVAALGKRARLLRKPFDMDALADAVEQLIGARATETLAG